MNNPESFGKYRPFKHLQALLEKKSIRLKSAQPDPGGRQSNAAPEPETDERLFYEAMQGVAPIRRNTRGDPDTLPRAVKPVDTGQGRCDTLRQLHRLIDCGEGFVVAHTPEYDEGVGHHVHPRLTRLLHEGRFSIQAHIDLHGLTVPEARQAFDAFVQDAVKSGKRAILVVHGRGLSSPRKPVLKSKVCEWLTSGPWRKWVMAFSSARACDGGTGATYVLLRQRPITRRYRKKHPCCRK
jgi:DNA-nicking Smr family endonuclease